MRFAAQAATRKSKGFRRIILVVIIVLGCSCTSLSACSVEPGDPDLLRNVYTELVDWHISGFAVINCPVAWVRVQNLNAIPIKNITLQYATYDIDGHLLNEGTYVIE